MVDSLTQLVSKMETKNHFSFSDPSNSMTPHFSEVILNKFGGSDPIGWFDRSNEALTFP
jgi:hypothetical protein